MLRTLAAKTEVERACELGTAFGVGAAWIASGLKTNASLVTVELDEHRATAATKLFAHTPAVTVFHGEWTLSLQQAPLDLLFSDGGPKREPGDAEKLLPLVRVGGLVVLDDFTAAGADNADASRRMWLENPTYDAHEVKVTKDDSVILAVRPR